MKAAESVGSPPPSDTRAAPLDPTHVSTFGGTGGGSKHLAQRVGGFTRQAVEDVAVGQPRRDQRSEPGTDVARSEAGCRGELGNRGGCP